MDSTWRYPIVTILLAAVVALPVAGPQCSQFARAAEPLDAAAVLGAIERGVAYLKREQDRNGRWDALNGYEGGVTSLCTLALMSAGLDATDPTVKRALDNLQGMNLNKTYSVALQTMALAAADPNQYRLKISENVKWLEQKQIKNGNRKGSWSYPGAGGDPSNAQFAVLALYEAQRVGVRVNPETWKLASIYWRDIQNGDGSWSYPGNAASGSMTCAGLGALLVTTKAIGEADARVEGGKVRCCVEQEPDENIEKGLAWLGRNFSVRRNPMAGGGDGNWHYYYLYGLERVGRLSAKRLIGEHDWYREGTEYLVKSQDPLAHYWKGNRHIERSPHISTAMALLFLAKGRRPLLMAKLDYEPNATAWNAHRHDADHLTRRTEAAWQLDLTWQTMDATGASVDDLQQAPVIYISGNRNANLSEHAEKLRGYVDRGGFIFAESPCGSGEEFRRSMEQLVERMFPEPEYSLRQLRPAHPIWRMEKLISPESAYVGSLWAVEYGCRTCVVFCDQDLSCYWELDKPGSDAYPASVQRRINDAAAIGLNVLAYATNREPRGKEQNFVDENQQQLLASSGTRGVIQIAKLQHGGGCNDAPGALANLTRAALNGETKIQIATTQSLVNIGDEAFFRHHLSFMHGRHDFRLTPTERKRLRQYIVENDGLLLADSICASPAFTKAFRRELLASLGDEHRLEQIPDDDSLFTEEYGGFDVRRVTVRDPQPAVENQPIVARTRQVAPQLEGVRIEGRWRVIFSPLDLSCALERHEAVECRGYSRQDAARIGLNVLLYSINQ